MPGARASEQGVSNLGITFPRELKLKKIVFKSLNFETAP
jgi:hypothetical protein